MKNNFYLKPALITVLMISFYFPIISQTSNHTDCPLYLSVFEKAYPDVSFAAKYDNEVEDYLIEIKSPIKPAKIVSLYWAGGRFLPASKLSVKNEYRTLLWNYPEELMDPATLSAEELKKLKEYGSDENRENGAITPSFFFDAVYGTATEMEALSHTTRISFFGTTIRVHDRIKEYITEIDSIVQLWAQTDSEINKFLKSLGQIDGYFWRTIRDTSGKSFHSYGLAIDILPKDLVSKSIYWKWEKDLNGDSWMKTPLSRRWMPPRRVIDLFESYGFVWGGKWAVWDNMHFEYHPELFVYRNVTNQ